MTFAKNFISIFLRFLLFSILATAVIGSPASGHTRSESFSKWRLQSGSDWGPGGDKVHISVTMKQDTALKMDWGVADLDSFKQVFVEHTVGKMVLKGDDAPCPLLSSPRIFVSNRTGYVRVEWSLSCTQGTDLTIHNNAFFLQDPSHTHIARLAFGDEPLIEKLFTARDRQWKVRSYAPKKADLRTTGAVGSSLVSYWLIGIDHIISGLDHLAFLLALLLLCRSIRDVIILVTGFTVGHSITLGLGVLGLINPNPQTVQALIGFTIALVAAENVGKATRTSGILGLGLGSAVGLMALFGAFSKVAGPPALTLAGLALFSCCYLSMIGRMADGGVKLRPAITMLFGLIHGFGFAGSLKEIGLPTDRFLSALLGFNLGVETGQLIIVFLFWIGIGMVIRLAPVVHQGFQQRLVTDVVSASLCGLGIFWFVSRAYE